VEAAGQCFVERCQASMKSRRHPGAAAAGDGSLARHVASSIKRAMSYVTNPAA
jgi:hypothetical protein